MHTGKGEKREGVTISLLEIARKVSNIYSKSPSAKRIYEYQEVLMCNF
jgi:hypothetical protein